MYTVILTSLSFFKLYIQFCWISYVFCLLNVVCSFDTKFFPPFMKGFLKSARSRLQEFILKSGKTFRAQLSLQDFGVLFSKYFRQLLYLSGCQLASGHKVRFPWFGFLRDIFKKSEDLANVFVLLGLDQLLCEELVPRGLSCCIFHVVKIYSVFIS